MEPASATILVIATTAVIQSVFGVGVLLFGTPWLLVLGVPFTEALWVLLPVSLAISCLQLLIGKHAVDWGTIRGIGKWTLPSVAVALWLTTVFRPPVELLVAVVVLAVAVMDRSSKVREVVDRLIRKRRTYLVFMGVIHGLSNLGGSLLTALVYARHHSKDVARATIATGYGLFAGIQLLTLWLTSAPGFGGYGRTLGTVALGATVLLVTEHLSRTRIDAARYRAGLSLLLVCTSCLLFFRALS
jgi:hypothetical protein